MELNSLILMADSAPKIYSKKKDGTLFIYGKVDNVTRPLFPKGKPNELNQSNLFNLLSALQRRELNQLNQNQEIRKKLLSYLDKPSKRKIN